MKQTVEEAAWQELMSSYAIVVKGEFAYQQQAMLNMFRKGVEWQAKQSPWISVEDAIPNKQAKGMCQVNIPLHQDWICYSLETYLVFR